MSGATDTLAMHRTLTQAGFASDQADAIVRVIEGGVATKQDVELLRRDIAGGDERLSARIDAADRRLSARIDADRRGSTRIDAADQKLSARIDKLDRKATLAPWGLGAAIPAPAITRLVLG